MNLVYSQVKWYCIETYLNLKHLRSSFRNVNIFVFLCAD